MAWEYKTVNIETGSENEVMERYGWFGWQLHSSQRIYNRDSTLEFDYMDKYGNRVYKPVTYVTDYMQLNFARDTSRPYYSRIAEDEVQFYTYINRAMAVQEEIWSTESSVRHYADKKCDYRTKEQKFKHNCILVGVFLAATFLYTIINTIYMTIIEPSFDPILLLVGGFFAAMFSALLPFAGIYFIMQHLLKRSARNAARAQIHTGRGQAHAETFRRYMEKIYQKEEPSLKERMEMYPLRCESLEMIREEAAKYLADARSLV